MKIVPTPSQTIGPFFHFCLTADSALGCLAEAGAQGERIRLVCRVLDGEGAAVRDAMLEVWQADAAGKYNHPDDTQDKIPDPAFRGFGRLCTDEDGVCIFETVKPGQAPGPGGTLQAPHVNVSIFARGLLRQLVTRVYFGGEPANGNDPILALVPADRRDTLMARPDTQHPEAWKFEIRLRGEDETVFFDV
jgi:protocatechuate 3,4-dioxygenase alpha subunit